uniref:Uncharacterized protein n=1 Tax=Bionectria ochroleuca TaxID=29856 RepID=A0A8H7NNG6_BIOOC
MRPEGSPTSFSDFILDDLLVDNFLLLHLLVCRWRRNTAQSANGLDSWIRMNSHALVTLGRIRRRDCGIRCIACGRPTHERLEINEARQIEVAARTGSHHAEIP